MNTLRVLASPRIWAPVLGVAAVLALFFYDSSLEAASPERG
jgi:hypothetical protein